MLATVKHLETGEEYSTDIIILTQNTFSGVIKAVVHAQAKSPPVGNYKLLTDLGLGGTNLYYHRGLYHFNS